MSPRTQTEPEAFDLTGPLPTGATVLEASAGTGKTFTIAALATRFVASGTPLDQLLIVTFTRAATSELQERVRERMVFTERELSRVVAGAPPLSSDAVVALLAEGEPDEVELRRARLEAAVSNFDAATISTTHGFCRRALEELGTLGDLEPDATFADNIDDLIREVIDDLYTRRFFSPRDRLTMSRREAGQVAGIAIENSTAVIHPLNPADGSAAAMRRQFAEIARNELARRKRALALMTHDDELTRLLATLRDEHGGQRAAAALRTRNSVVLIDEFQDTDPVQWEIVQKAFDHEGVTLVLIGDPKQAIYGFRGADVYAYIDAAEVAGRRATLDVNHRSDQDLLTGLDALFGDARLGHPEIEYRHMRAATAAQNSRLHDAPVAEALRVRILDSTDPALETNKSGYPTGPSARDLIARDLADDVVRLLASQATLERPDPHGGPAVRGQIAPGDVAVLVYSHQQAALIRDRLVDVGVPAVINGAGSVFGTDAAGEWRVLLEALERPASSPRARAAALTAFIGWNAEQLAAAGESELDQLHQRLYGWARVLREHGVATLTATVMAQTRVPERVLARVDGERRMTDLQHIAQVLHGAASAEHLGLSALTGWLRERIAAAREEGSNEELTRRLDSDAAAVQVLTIHRSKGLEFPIVYCPFLSYPRKRDFDQEPIYFHDPDAGYLRSVDVGLEGAGYKRHLHQHAVEERGEDLRAAYVALTRARHQVTIWWASTWDSKNSPLSRLLFERDSEGNIAWEGGGIADDAAAWKRFEEVARIAPASVSLERAQAAWPPVRWQGDIQADSELTVAHFDRELDTRWRRTSYTAITAAAHDALIGSEPEERGIADEPPAPDDALASTELPLSTMTGGTQVGTVIHRVLERVDFDAEDLTASLTALLDEWARPGVLGTDTADVAAGLAVALSTPLKGERGSLRLTEVTLKDRLDELAFELPLAGGDTPSGDVSLAEIATLLRSSLPAGDPFAVYADRLTDPTLTGVFHGYLTGSIDLVVRAADPAGRIRYSVVDYKTNWLAGPGEELRAWNYRPEALALEMQRTHYALQALLYSVALHRYLRWRLPSYDPERDLGAVHYLFLRGMLGADARTGVFTWNPPAGLIVDLSELLDGR